jgi:hypothetical protein
VTIALGTERSTPEQQVRQSTGVELAYEGLQWCFACFVAGGETRT